MRFLAVRCFRVHSYCQRRWVNMSAQPAITIPDGFTLHTENTSHILLPSTNETFLNPIQEFNRDLSVACITTWSEARNRTKEAKWKLQQEKRAKKGSDKKRFKSKQEHSHLRSSRKNSCVKHSVDKTATGPISEAITIATPETVAVTDDGASGSQDNQVPVREVCLYRSCIDSI